MRLTEPDEGWAWVVLFAAFVANVITGCFQYAVGVIHNALLDRFNEDVSKTTWAGSLYVCLLSLTGIVTSVIINRYSCRVAMVIGGLLMTLGFAASAILKSLDAVIVSYGFIAGTGAGICCTSHMIILGYNFQRKRNFAYGIAVSGCGLGTLALAPVMEYSREYYGNSGFFFILAGIALHMVLCGVMFFPSKLEIYRKTITLQTKMKPEKIGDESKNNKLYSILVSLINHFKILKRLNFCCFSASWFFAGFGVSLVYVHFSRYVIEMNSTPLQASLLLSFNGLCNCFSRILAGMAANADNIDEILVYFGTFGTLGISTITFPLYSSTFGGQAAFACFLGLYSGCCYAVMSSLVVQFAGLSNLASGVGIVCFFTGVGSFVGPLLAGFIIDGGGSYGQAFILAGFAVLLAALLAMFTVCFGKREDLPHHGDTEQIIVKETEKLPNDMAIKNSTKRYSNDMTGNVTDILLNENT